VSFVPKNVSRNLKISMAKICISCKEPNKFPQNKRCIECSFKFLNSPEGKAKKEKARIASQKRRDKRERKRQRERKEGLLTLPQWIKKAQPEFNKFVRFRDYDDSCISCYRSSAQIAIEDVTSSVGGLVCGHYLSIGGYPELRFNEDNANLQCTRCNGGDGKFGQFNKNKLTITAAYRVGLVKKIGLKRVEALESPHEPNNYIIEEVKEIRVKYRTMANALKKEIDNEA